jgi:hypothetical protein
MKMELSSIVSTASGLGQAVAALKAAAQQQQAVLQLIQQVTGGSTTATRGTSINISV